MRFLKFFQFSLLIAFTLCTISFPFFPLPAHAQTSDQNLTDIQNQINQYTALLNQAQGQEKSLKSELDYIDAQTKITELKIQQTNYEITDLNSQIQDLDGRIGRVSATLDTTTNLLLNQIVSTYKYSNVSGIDLLFSSNGFSDLLQRIKDIDVAQAYDKKLLIQLQATKSAYNDQKSDKQTRQEQQQQLQAQLASYSSQLQQEQAGK